MLRRELQCCKHKPFTLSEIFYFSSHCHVACLSLHLEELSGVLSSSVLIRFISHCYLLIVLQSVGATVSFNQSTYIVSEETGLAQPVLVLSNPSSTNIRVGVNSMDGTATGECNNCKYF